MQFSINYKSLWVNLNYVIEIYKVISDISITLSFKISCVANLKSLVCKEVISKLIKRFYPNRKSQLEIKKKHFK